ncbi:methyl-accepting chemotaxis protein [Novosphingobium sp.]|uniref:methyl-accepting chemotaxis protein n=1 Tax=Novosphingobium sp. TaxID=1874826 RepID=UPI0038BC491B
MRILVGLRIKTLVVAGSLVLAAMAIIAGVTGIAAVGRVGGHLDYATNNTIPSLKALNALDDDAFGARLAVLGQILAPAEADKRKLDAQIDDEIGAAGKDLADYRELVSDEQEAAIFAKTTAAWQQWVDVSKPVRKAALEMHTDVALQLVQTRLNPAGDALEAAINAQVEYNQKLAEQENKDGAEVTSGSRKMLIVISVVAALVSAAVIGAFFARVIRPLGNMTGAMTVMASGDLDRQVPFIDQPDEIGDIARALDTIRTAVSNRAKVEADAQMDMQREVVGALGKGLAALRDGRLTVRLTQTFPGDYETLRHDFNQSMDELAATIGEVVKAAQGVRVGAGEIAAAATDLSNRTETQAASLEESAAAVRQLAASADNAAEAATDAGRTATEASSEARISDSAMGDAVAAMEEIARSSARMEAIVAIIDGIAFQTNLLALNAGVEAARAGESGKGFAVVATEVRALAQRSADAAREINEIIRTSGRDVANGVGMMGQTRSALERIVERIEHLSGSIGTLARTSEEQSLTIRHVDSAVSGLDSMTQQNAALVEQSSAASRSLAHAADTLGSLVARFDLGAGSGTGSTAARYAA